jgi:hypothetical protein
MLSKRISLATRLPRGSLIKSLVLKSLHRSILKSINSPEFMKKLDNRLLVEDGLYVFAKEGMVLEVFEVLTMTVNIFPDYSRFKLIRNRLLNIYLENSSAKNLLVDGWMPGGNGAIQLSEVDQNYISNCIYLDCLSSSLDPIVAEQLQAFFKKP